MTSSTTCSISAVESTIIALIPPVSAMSGAIAPSLSASVRLIRCATSTEPVKTTPAVNGSATSAAPIAPSPGVNCSTSFGRPDSRRSAIAMAATSGVCSAGLATTQFPAASAAAIWPMKIASGKFQGEMQIKTPRPYAGAGHWLRPSGPAAACRRREFAPGRRSSGKDRPPRAPRRAHRREVSRRPRFATRRSMGRAAPQ